MSNFTIEIKVPELSAAIAKLAEALAPSPTTSNAAPVLTAGGVIPGALAGPVMPVAPVTPAAAPVPVVPITPVNPPAPPAIAAMPQAPTAAPPAYSYDDLARAASTLMDTGKQPELLGLLSQFGIQALTQLPKERYGEFATALRQMGAQI